MHQVGREMASRSKFGEESNKHDTIDRILHVTVRIGPMEQRHRIEELRKRLGVLKHDAPSLYQYGDFGQSLNLVNGLHAEDRRRRILLGLTAADQDTRNIAKRLMSTLTPKPANVDELIGQLSPEARDEIKTSLLGNTPVCGMWPGTPEDRNGIAASGC